MKRLLTPPVALVFFLGTALAVLLYNTWSYGCGRCSLQTFLTLGPPGVLLLIANAAALAILLSLKFRRRQEVARRRCRCGSQVVRDWHFCPECGQRISSFS